MKTGSNLRALFIAMAALLVASATTTYWLGVDVLRSNREVIVHQQAIQKIEETLTTVVDAETGQRGYLITGEEKYLDPYKDAVGRIHAEFQSLDDWPAGGLISTGSVNELTRLTNDKLAELDETISTRRTQGAVAAIAIVKSDRGRKTMEAVRQQVALMLDNENSQLGLAQSSMHWRTYFRTIAYVVVCMINLAFLLWAYRRIGREIAEREIAAAETLRQKELLNVTLSSIGDAVIVTDVHSRITFFNKIAEQLTGWKRVEAIGQPCASIFRIINEDTRQPVPSPVEKVLKTGTIVGLANHTVLLSKDGREIPIDDSGAPVREPSGIVRGVVLIFRDFSEHKAAEQRLRTAKTELETANKAKDQFLATLSHELRTPLTPVLATLSTWELQGGMSPELSADVQMLRRNVELEARLIDDLLDLTRIVRGKITLNVEPSDVHELIASVTDMYHSEIRARNLHVTMHLDAQRHHVNADPGRLQQVFWNVLKNATKFTNEGGAIDIASCNLNDEFQLTIADNGIGMSEQTLGQIFRPFEQGDDEIVRRYGGLGLGMAISKALMNAQGGAIKAASEGPGHGSKFTISLPALDVPIIKHAESSPPRPGDKNHAPLKILLVEDHPDTAMVMSRLLKHLGHEVQTSNSMASALEQIHTSPFDIVVSDIGLPDGTGIDLIKQIRAQNSIPAIALTGFGMEEDIAKCHEAGFNAHLTKPVNFQKLEMTIHQLASGGADDKVTR